MMDLGARMMDLGARTMDLGARMMDLGARMMDLGARTMQFGCRVGGCRNAPAAFYRLPPARERVPVGLKPNYEPFLG
jgi:hypothetical protein